ncbi:hypothetical protein GCM10009433_19420 [Psychroflexus lacisalsi]|uniref:DUF2490 domain-containing protein n=2 Tax=Psychroflexus lacisalsi TaxID=503928 RepID=A0ABP3VIP8_9FLAO
MYMKFNGSIKFSLFFVFIASFVFSQEDNTSFPDQSILNAPETLTWINSYGTFRLSEKWFWHGELHYRMRENDSRNFIGDVAQVYNRHGIQYIPNKSFKFTLGGVLRVDFGDQSGDAFEKIRLEPRIWHEYQWIMPYERFRIYHRIRIEHRWKKSFQKGSEYVFGNRWRYKFMMKIPLNKPKLQPGAFYFNPDVELIMQSGKSIVDNPIEDLRFYPGIGYIASPRVSYSANMMYTTGQSGIDGGIYRERWIFKFNVYINLDLRKFDDKIPETRFYD